MQLLAHTMDMNKKIPTISVQISVTPSAKKVIDDLAEQTEIPQKRVMSKLYEWFADLPVPAQKSILWPDETAEEVEAMQVAIEYLNRRKAELRINSARENDQSAAGDVSERTRIRAVAKLREVKDTLPKQPQPGPSR